MVPYTLDVNDMKFSVPPGFTSPDGFYQYLKDSFDTLYEEGFESVVLPTSNLTDDACLYLYNSSAIHLRYKRQGWHAKDDECWIASQIDWKAWTLQGYSF